MSSITLLVDGYISQSFRSKDAEGYFCHLLKTNSSGLKQSCQALMMPGCSDVLFVVKTVPNAISPRSFMQGPDGGLLWLLDHSVVPTGTVVPQALWSPQNVNDFKQYVSEAPLQLPIFFIHETGALGLSLSDAANGRCHTLREARLQAQLGGKSTTHIRIMWPGYADFRRQVQIKDETAAKNPITVAKFAHHIGRSVEAFLRELTPNSSGSPGDHNWVIGQGGIVPANIRIIGAIHVSAGSWMPILQLNSYVFYGHGSA
ncbi:hypothetical protein F5148DRAFT_1170347 [Russula earlei]|uniref:Uncharacterized protein n=1 Tax=Russula earlei TaxID=71964 RepID=A0ACC0UKG8_9AGAM|nr:hypothetical protein F5148DRAFT_1170347 [Russula earlei]